MVWHPTTLQDQNNNENYVFRPYEENEPRLGKWSGNLKSKIPVLKKITGNTNPKRHSNPNIEWPVEELSINQNRPTYQRPFGVIEDEIPEDLSNTEEKKGPSDKVVSARNRPHDTK